MKVPSLIVILIFVLFIASCNKNDINNPSRPGKAYPISFNLGGFQVINGLSNSTLNESSLSTTIHTIKYWVYKHGTYDTIKTLIQSSLDSGFGQIHDSLPYGSYDIYFAGLKNTPGNHLINNNEIFPSTNYFGGPLINFNFQNDYSEINDTILTTDCFASKKLELTISGQPISQEIIMERIMGDIDIYLNDSASLTNTSVVIDRLAVPLYYDLEREKPNPIIPDQPSGTYFNFQKFSNGHFEAYIPGDSDPMTLYIFAYSNGTKYTKTIKQVVSYKNKKVIIKGNILDSSDNNTNQGLKLKIDSTWSNDTISINF